MRPHIFVDQDRVKPIRHDEPCLTVCNSDGVLLQRGRRIRLSGEWILRQYNNPVPCGATVVLYPIEDQGTYVMEDACLTA